MMNEPDSITYGTLTDGTVLFAKRLTDREGYQLYEFKPSATYPFAIQTGNYLQACQSTAIRLIQEDKKRNTPIYYETSNNK